MIQVLKRLSIVFVLAVLSLILTLIVMAYWGLTTTEGAKTAYRLWRQNFVLPFDMTVGIWDGNLLKGLTLKDIELTAVSYLPAKAKVKIQELKVSINGLKPDAIDIFFNNARVILGKNDPVVIQGHWQSGKIDANVFARTLDIGLVTKYIPFVENPTLLSGFVSHADIAIRGDLNKLDLVGRLFVDHIEYGSTIVSQGPGEFHLVANVPAWQLVGEASMSDGVVQARHIVMDLTPSKVYFKTDPYNPQLDIHASSVVDKVTIDLSFRGSLRVPELELVSDPQLPSEVLMVMLATGKSWNRNTVINTPKTTTLSGEIVSGFFDYLLLGGGGGNFARQYGITDAKGPYSGQSNRIGIKKKIADDVRVGIELEQMPSSVHNEQGGYTKRLEGEMDVTDHVSVNVSQQVLPQDKANPGLTNGSNPAEKDKNETQIYLKYQNRF